MAVNQVLANFPPNSNFVVPTSNQGPVVMTVGGPPGGSGPPFTTTGQLWVANWGSDTTGDGSIFNPFLTIAHAQSVVTDASPTKFYNIMLYPGTYTENVAAEAFINVVGFNPSDIFQALYPSIISGNVTLGSSFGGTQVGQFSIFTNVDIDGTTTLDFVALSASSNGFVSFSNAQLEDNVTWTGTPDNGVELHNVNMFGNYSQTGGQSTWFGSSGGFSSQTLTLQDSATSYAFLRARGGSWQGPITTTYTGPEGSACEIDSSGFSMTGGTVTKVANANGVPAINANIGDLAENVVLVTGENPLSPMDPQMRISHPFTGITGSVDATAVTTFTFVVPPTLIGGTSIETLHCSCTPVGANWGTIFGPHAAIFAFRYVQSGASATIELVILNTGLAFDITDPLAFNFYAYLPSVLA